jgi:hypothetical protein
MRTATVDLVQCFATAYNDRIQLSPYQAQVIGGAIRSRAPGCRLLVFGLGYDTDLWLSLNADGETHFVESSAEWMSQAVERNPGLSVSLFDGHGLTVATSSDIAFADLERYPVPAAIADRQWDVIIVDGPKGYRPGDPGRALPIYWAQKLAGPKTHVFIDDYERSLEQRYGDALFRERRGTASYVIQASDHLQHRKMLWSAGSPIVEAARPVVLTIATGDYAEKWRFCIDSQRTYCRRHGYDHHVLTSIEDGLHPKWAKLSAAVRLLEKGTDVLLIDADAEIAETCPPLTDLLADDKSDIFYVLGKTGRPNSGVLLLRGGSESAALAFLTECLARRSEPVPAEDFVTADGENGHVIWLLKSPDHSRRSRILDEAWNCSNPGQAAHAYIRHYTNPLRAWHAAAQNKAPEPTRKGVISRLATLGAKALRSSRPSS